MISLIVARAKNSAIGRDGDMPWDLPEDLAMFQRETRGGAVIMGRRTWESLPVAFRPLKGRFNVVVSRSEVAGPDAVVTSITDAIA
ncbi:dihydrofolate reductase, partial [Yoonia sp.]|uniref:dihydrofolate reductase n=1 Tax=Yoonia sp. TaxID=2212373 RepID=UPI0023830C9F